jgi:threonine/homoserine/homoserine lactone efflux protein
MGYESMNPKPPDPNAAGGVSRSLLKGILANAVSPHPYLFWFSVGGPILSRATKQGMAAPVAFIVCFYVFLVGSKMVLAVVVGRSKSFLSGKVYRYIMRFLGLALCVLALLLFRDGLTLLGLIHF